jgi:hypothetical protein
VPIAGALGAGGDASVVRTHRVLVSSRVQHAQPAGCATTAAPTPAGGAKTGRATFKAVVVNALRMLAILGIRVPTRC